MDDKYLIAELKRKNKTVFDFVFNYYYSGLCAFARKWVNDHETAEDLVQDFFFNLWINGYGLEISSSLKSYLFTSVKNKALNHLKHIKIKEGYVKFAMDEANRQIDSPNWEFAEPELTELIENGIQKLPPRCREIFILSRFQGKDNKSISNLLGISKRTVELQISNALKILRTELKDYLPLALLFYIFK